MSPYNYRLGPEPSVRERTQGLDRVWRPARAVENTPNEQDGEGEADVVRHCQQQQCDGLPEVDAHEHALLACTVALGVSCRRTHHSRTQSGYSP
jgi:hypothetical protein